MRISKKTYKLISKFAREFKYDYGVLKRNFRNLSSENKDQYIIRMELMLEENRKNKIRSKSLLY